MSPLLSVILPAYRTRELAVRAARSALGQVGVHVEVIAVDDASGDGTAELLRELCDPRLRVFEQPVNRGPSAARNRALDLARGEWIALLDSDDWYASGRCAHLLRIAETEGLDLLADNLWLVPHGSTTARGTLFAGRLRVAREFDPASFVRATIPGRFGLALGVTKPLLRRRFVERHALRFDEDVRYTEGFHFYVRCLLAGGRFAAIPDAHYYYTHGRPGAVTYHRRLGNLRQALVVTEALLTASGALDPLVQAALMSRHRSLRDDIVLHEVLEPLSKLDIVTACRRALRSPRALSVGFRRIPSLTRRVRARLVARSPIAQSDSFPVDG
jgi:succinoglycan biosynthesis protein ExoO